MKKVGLVSIVLGVLLLVGMMMSGLSLLQAEQTQAITFEEFLKSPESFMGKEVELTEGVVISEAQELGRRGKSFTSYIFYTITSEEITPIKEWIRFEEWKPKKDSFTVVYFPLSLVAIEGEEYKRSVMPTDIVTVKGVVEVITKAEVEKIIEKFHPNDTTTFDEMVKWCVYNEFTNTVEDIGLGDLADLRKSKIEKVYCIKASEIKVTGQIPYPRKEKQLPQECETLWWYDNEHYYCQQKEFSEMYMYEGLHVFKTKAECEEALRNSIPDYENFPIKYYDSFDKDKDGNPELVIRQYIREIQKEELEAQQKPIKTFYDSVATLGRPSFGGEEILAWIPNGKLYFSTDEVTDVLKAEGMDCNYKHIRYAIKENGQWRLVDEQTYIAKAAEILKSVNSTKT